MSPLPPTGVVSGTHPGYLSDRALHRRSEEALYQAARTHFRGRRSELRRMVRRYLKPHRHDRSLLASLVTSLTRALFVALLMLQLWATPAQAQPSFSSSSPANATHAAAVGNNISATFSEAIASGTVSASTFVVHGGFIGQHGTGGTANTHRDATLTGGGTTTLNFDPGANFAPGELVSVSLTTGLQNGSAQALSAAKVFQFRAAATGGPAVFSNVSRDVESGTTNRSFSAALGDLNGDGDLDLVTGNYTQVNRVYLGTGSGAFSAGTNLDAATNSTNATSLGDLDGDGDLDLVVGDAGTVNRVYLGNGSGSFGASSDVESGVTNNSYDTQLGDLDGDGDLDLLIGNLAQVNRVHLGDGSGAFAAGNDVESGVTNATRSAQLGDLDDDGDLDLITVNAGSQADRVYLNTGNGSFAAGSDVETGVTIDTRSAALGDLDGDGDLDLVTGHNGLVNKIHLGTGSGTFAAGTDVETGTTNKTRAMSLGDLDGDGDLDLITGNYTDFVDRLYLGDGSGSFAAGTNATASASRTVQTLLGDLDGDGDLDLIAANDQFANRVHLNNNTSFSSSSPTVNANNTATTSNVSATFTQSMQAATSSTFVVHGSMTGKRAGSYSGASSTTLTFDPTKDFEPGEVVDAMLLLGLRSTSGDALQPPKNYRFRAAAAAGPAVFSHVTSDVETGTTNQTWSTSLGDLDGDGRLDLIIGNRNGVDRVHLGTGSGAFAAGNDVEAGVTITTWSTSLGDLDGDGDLDLFTGKQAFNVVYLGDGSGTFAAGSNVGASSDTRGTSLGDLDGDGDLDLVAGDYGLLNRVYLGNGNGTFAAATVVEAGTTNSTWSVPLGDLDGDGDLDLITGNASLGQANRVYLGDGTGAFAAGSDVEAGTTNRTYAMSLGDLDGDGDLDLITGNNSQVNRIYLGDGSGAFAAGNDVEAGTTNQTRAVSLGDLDGDGDLDLITGNYSQANRLYLSNGNGTFAAGSNVDSPTNKTSSAPLGDLDGDGDLDIVTGNIGQVNRVYLNSGNHDATLTASATLDESSAISLIDTIDTQAEAKGLFDFTLTDGGGGDNLALGVSKIVLNTSGTGPFSQITWLLNGPDATNAVGTYSSGANTITFSGLSLSVADAANETYTLSGYYNDKTSLSVGKTFSFSIDGDTDATVSITGSEMSGSNAAVSNAAATQVAIFLNSDGALTASSTLDESSSIGLAFAAQSAATAVDLLDFNLTDGGGGDGLALEVTQIVVSTSGTGNFSGVTWLLNGPDASDVIGTVGTNTITFSGLSISVAEAQSEVYTISGYFNDLSSVVEGHTYLLSLDGDTALTLASTGSAISGSNSVVNNAGTAVAIPTFAEYTTILLGLSMMGYAMWRLRASG